MILSPAALEAVFATGEQIAPVLRLTDPRDASSDGVATENTHDSRWAAHSGPVDAPASGSDRAPMP